MHQSRSLSSHFIESWILIPLTGGSGGHLGGWGETKLINCLTGEGKIYLGRSVGKIIQVSGPLMVYGFSNGPATQPIVHMDNLVHHNKTSTYTVARLSKRNSLASNYHWNLRIRSDHTFLLVYPWWYMEYSTRWVIAIHSPHRTNIHTSHGHAYISGYHHTNPSYHSYKSGYHHTNPSYHSYKSGYHHTNPAFIVLVAAIFIVLALFFAYK